MSEPTPLELAIAQNTYEAGYITGWIEQEERIIKLLEDNCECIFEINKYYSGCHNHQIIALIGKKSN